jgi:hypothetical protein
MLRKDVRIDFFPKISRYFKIDIFIDYDLLNVVVSGQFLTHKNPEILALLIKLLFYRTHFQFCISCCGSLIICNIRRGECSLASRV